MLKRRKKRRRWAWSSSRRRSRRRFGLDQATHPSYSSCHYQHVPTVTFFCKDVMNFKLQRVLILDGRPVNNAADNERMSVSSSDSLGFVLITFMFLLYC
jgi:hypothetical protein